MIIKIEKIAKEAKVKLPDLITRPVGKKMYGKILEKLSDIGIDETIIMDFSEIKVIDSSFIDEFIVSLVNHSYENNYFLKLNNISNIIEINIESVFQSYSDYNKRIAIMRDDLGNNNKYYIGPLVDFENDIIDYLRVNKHASIEDVVKFSGIDDEGSKKILNDLVDLRMIRFYDNKYTNV